MGKINILFVINDLFLGGTQRVVYEIASRLPKDEYDVSLCYFKKLPDGGKKLHGQFVDSGIRVFCLNGELHFGFKEVIGFIRTVLKVRPDIIHAHLPLSVIVSAVLGRLVGVPRIIAHEHNTYALSPKKISLVRKLIQPLLSYTICYTEDVEIESFGDSYVLKMNNFKSERRSCTIYNGVNFDVLNKGISPKKRSELRSSLGIKAEDIFVFSVGRLITWKGHMKLIEAMNLLNYRKDVKVRIAGYGPLEQELNNFIKENSLEETVQLLGGRDDVPDLLHSADVFSLALDYPAEFVVKEAVGIAGLEGMAVGLPTLVADYPSAHRFIIPNKNAILVEPSNAKALAEAILLLADNEELRKNLGEEAAKYVQENFSWDKINLSYQFVYKRLNNYASSIH